MLGVAMAHSAGSLPAEDTKWWVVCQRGRYSVRTKFGTRAGVLSDRVDYDPSAVGADSFDVATEVIEHLVRPHNLPGFAKQLLRPGGHLIISTPYHGYLKNSFIALSNKWDSAPRGTAAISNCGHARFPRRSLHRSG
jgi:hypothetical protein